MTLERTVAVLLCAGESRRFGEADKLLHLLDGKPLVAHAAEMLAALPFTAKIATVRPNASALHAILAGAGFTLHQLPLGADQAASLRCGLEAALALCPQSILLILGDMPWVSAQHIAALSQAASEHCPAASQGDGWTGPPWVAPVDWVRANIDTLKPALLHDAVAVGADDGVLRDVDRVEDVVADNRN